MLMPRDLIYGLARKLRSTPSLSKRTYVIIQAIYEIQPAVRDSSPEDDAQAWHNIQQSGLLDLLITLLSEPYGDASSFGQFLEVGMDLVRLCLMVYWVETKSLEWEPILLSVSGIFRNSVPTTTRQLYEVGSTMEDLAVSIQQSGVRLLVRILRVFEDMETSAKYFDADGILDLVLAVLFTPQILPNSAQTRLDGLCGKVILSFPYDVCVQYPAVESIQKRYSCDHIALKCVDLCSKSYENEPLPLGLMQVITLLNHVAFPGMNHAFLRRDVYGAVMQNQWAFLKTGGSSQTTKVYPDAFTTYIMTRMFWPLSKLGTQPLLTTDPDIFRKNDVLLLLGKALSAPKHALFRSPDQAYDMEQSIRRWGIIFTAAYRADPDFKENHCRVQWTHTMQRFLALQRCNLTALDADTDAPYFRYDFAVQLWRQFGEELQLVGTESDDGAEARQAPRRCGWIMCPLNGIECVGGSVEWEMLRCTGCRQVHYCGPPCQRRHWRSAHQQECRLVLPLSLGSYDLRGEI